MGGGGGGWGGIHVLESSPDMITYKFTEVAKSAIGIKFVKSLVDLSKKKKCNLSYC